MGKALKLIGLFLVFMFTGVLITGLVMGSLHTTKTFEVKTTPDTCFDLIADTSNYRLWMSNMESIVRTTHDNFYNLVLNDGKGKKRTFNLHVGYLRDVDTFSYFMELNNRGSNLEIHFTFEPENTGTKVRIEHRVKGKGIANKLALAMLNTSLKKQYLLETNRIKQLLERNAIE